MSLRAIILGGDGTLGRALTSSLPGLGYVVAATLNRGECDITDDKAVSAVVTRFEPEVIFNSAAFTNVDRAEDDIDAAWKANALGPEILARAAERSHAALVHYSTDFVFDGEMERPYDEFDPPSPQGVYARTKLAGEQLAARAARRVFVLRVGCLYGRGGRNFPSTILSRLRAGETIRADGARSGSPSWVQDVARVSAALARTDHFGLYHCTSAGETTWLEYARYLADQLKLPAERVEAVDTTKLSLKAARPRRAILDNRMLRLRGLDSMPTWQEAAVAFLRSELEQPGTSPTKA